MPREKGGMVRLREDISGVGCGRSCEYGFTSI